MKHNRLSIRDGGLYMESHNHDSLGYHIGKALADIHAIRAAVEDMPELVNPKGAPPKNKRSYIRETLRDKGLIA